jgi:hypothetical protein
LAAPVDDGDASSWGVHINKDESRDSDVDYATFLVRTTIDMQRFSDGTFARPGLVPGCGGPLQLLVVDRNGATWAQAPVRPT